MEADIKGLQIVTKDNLKLHMHLLLSSYVVDIPEAEDLHGLKRGNKTFYRCHLCYASRELFSGYTASPKRSAMVTFKLVESLDVCHEPCRRIRRCLNTRCFQFRQF